MNQQMQSGINPMAMTAVMAAVMGVTAPFVLPVGPVPLSLCTLAVYLTAYMLGRRRGTAAVLVYILLGAAGMPVFSGFSGGLGKVLGPTGGYILGYLPLAWIAGWAVERSPRNRAAQLVGMALATGALYALGTAWYCLQAQVELKAALMLCVLPFMPGDLVKIGVALTAGPAIRHRLEQAGLHPAG